MKRALALLTLPLLIITFIIIRPRLAPLFSYKYSIDTAAETGSFNPAAKPPVFNNQKLDSPNLVADTQTPPSVLGQTTGSKRIQIDLAHQKLYAYENDQLVYEFSVSSGKWARTPTGTFNIWVKLRYSKMEGGSKALNTYYYLPNVPYIMYFANDEVPRHRGFGLHGTYWHNNFGHPMSHGCINMRTEDAEKIYYWAQPDLNGQTSVFASEDNPGTPITIFGVAPWE